MKRQIYALALSTLLLLPLCACDSADPPADTAQASPAPFDLEEAADMVDEVEWLYTWLQTQTSVSRADGEALAARMDQLLGEGQGDNMLSSYVDGKAWEDESLEELEIVRTWMQPTVYYEDVALTSAVVETAPDGKDWLTIRKEYTGEDERWKDWSLEYVFCGNDGEGWTFSSYNGVFNVEDPLTLKDSFSETEYSFKE